MKFLSNLLSSAVLTLAGIVASPQATQAAPAKPAASASATNAAPVAIPESVFVIPTKPDEGRDPFFPDSTRVYQTSQPKVTKAPVAPVSLVLNGLTLGTRHERLAMVNGHTFAEGEEADVNTPNGKCRVHCVKIGDGSVLVEVNGERRELHMAGAL